MNCTNYCSPTVISRNARCRQSISLQRICIVCSSCPKMETQGSSSKAALLVMISLFSKIEDNYEYSFSISLLTIQTLDLLHFREARKKNAACPQHLALIAHRTTLKLITPHGFMQLHPMSSLCCNTLLQRISCDNFFHCQVAFFRNLILNNFSWSFAALKECKLLEKANLCHFDVMLLISLVLASQSDLELAQYAQGSVSTEE